MSTFNLYYLLFSIVLKRFTFICMQNKDIFSGMIKSSVMHFGFGFTDGGTFKKRELHVCGQ